MPFGAGMPLPVVQPASGEPAAERRTAGVAAGALDLRWLALTLFWPLIDLRAAPSAWWPALALAAGYGLAGGAVALPMARFSDRAGRRLTLALGNGLMVLAAMALALPALAPWAPWARLAMGLGAGAGFGAAVGWVSDRVDIDRRPRAHGLFALSATVAALIGPALGSVIGLGPRWGAPAIIGALGLLSLAALPRTAEPRKICPGEPLPQPRADTLYAVRSILGTAVLAGPLLATLCAYAAAALVAGLVPGALGTLGPGWIAGCAALALLCGAVGLALSSRLVDAGRGGAALTLGLCALWVAGLLLSQRSIDHAAGPVWLALPALALLVMGAALCASAGTATLLARAPELWRATSLFLHPVAAFLGAGMGGAMAVLVSMTVGPTLAPIPVALLVIVGLAGALRRGPAPSAPITAGSTLPAGMADQGLSP
jgi:MFS family permease